MSEHGYWPSRYLHPMPRGEAMLTVQFDEHGLALPDLAIEPYLRERLRLDKTGLLHIGSTLILDCLRALLLATPEEDRPAVKWVFYGREVHFNRHLQSDDAYDDERMTAHEAWLGTLLVGQLAADEEAYGDDK